MKDLKVIFMGTPDFSVPILQYLIDNTNVILVVTKTDKEVGRDKKMPFSPIKKLAIQNNIDVFQPIKIRKDYEIISEMNPDIIVTCAYGQIISKDILDIPKLGCINVHASLLPKYRGAAPIQWAMLNGEKETGVTLMYMDEGVDTGNIIASKSCLIEENDNIESLHQKLSLIGVDLLKETLPKIVAGTNERMKQDESKATFTTMIKREDELLSFDDNGINIINKIRAFNPWPLAYFVYKGQEIKIINASYEKEKIDVNKILFTKKEMLIGCKDGAISLHRIKPFGKKEMDVFAYLNGISKDKEAYVDIKNI